MTKKRWLGEHVTTIFPVLSLYAGGIAFFFLLSLVPFLVVTMGIVDFFSPVDLTGQMTMILLDLIPDQEILNVEAMMQAAQKAGVRGFFTITFLFAFWTAFSFMASLTQALHLVFSKESIAPKRGWRVHVYSLVMVAIWSLFLALTAVLFLAAPVWESWLERSMQWPWLETLALKAVRYAFLGVMFVLAFGACYRLNAKKSTKTKWCFEGGLLATLGWLVTGWAFTYVLPVMWRGSVAFGALGSIVVTLMWAYAAAWMVLLGAIWVLLRDRSTILVEKKPRSG
ncbi:MAG: YihY/virulence factor BrkB family protein [Candidatus Methylacidiphilales bacterium]